MRLWMTGSVHPFMRCPEVSCACATKLAYRGGVGGGVPLVELRAGEQASGPHLEYHSFVTWREGL